MTARYSGHIDHASAWRGSELQDRDNWIIHLTHQDIGELDAALQTAKATGKTATALTREDFPLKHLPQTVAGWVKEVNHGRGFVLVRGLPVERYSDAEVRTIFWGLGLHLGVPRPQGKASQFMSEVRDAGGTYRSTAMIDSDVDNTARPISVVPSRAAVK